MKTLDYIALILVAIGAINWGLIGFFDFDLVRVIYNSAKRQGCFLTALFFISL